MLLYLIAIKPIHDDWDAIHCYEFRQLVENKAFVATVYAIKNVGDDPVLQLGLCDTSGDTDVYVANTLIERGYAKLKDMPFTQN